MKPIREKTKGRPRVNRNLALRLILSGKYDNKQLRRKLKCGQKTLKRIYDELEEEGLLEKQDRNEPDEVEADFDEECIRATGISFKEWCKTKTKNWKQQFDFGNRVWANVWGRPSLVQLRDTDNELGDQLCIRFLRTFGDDTKRIRRRKVQIRYLFRFLGRHDLCDRHLTVTESRDPRPVREIPEISMIDFPLKFQAALDEIRYLHGFEAETMLQVKLCGLMRTGRQGKSLTGLTVGTDAPSYVYFSDVDNWRIRVLEKDNEKWNIEWMPRPVREKLYKIYDSREIGERLFQFNIRELSKAWGEATRKHIGKSLKLHDIRKVALTWLWIMDIPLEVATTLNVGWKDLNTARKHYLHLRGLLKNSSRETYRANIPYWFKEGLGEYRKI
jgi:hypothetical protein